VKSEKGVHGSSSDSIGVRWSSEICSGTTVMVSPFVMQVVPIIRFMQYLDDWYKRGVKGFYPSPVSFHTV